MITVMLDNDISGHRDLFAGTLRATSWDEYNLVRFVTMEEAGIASNSDDREVWRFCQRNSLILLTANRNKDDSDSLEETLEQENTANSLPVITVTDPQRIAEPAYRESCVYSLLNIILDLNNYLGSARQFIP